MERGDSRTRRSNDRPVSFQLDLRFEEQRAPHEVANGEVSVGAVLRTRIFVSIAPRKSRDRRRADALPLAHQALVSLRSYLMATCEDQENAPNGGRLGENEACPDALAGEEKVGACRCIAWSNFFFALWTLRNCLVFRGFLVQEPLRTHSGSGQHAVRTGLGLAQDAVRNPSFGCFTHQPRHAPMTILPRSMFLSNVSLCHECLLTSGFFLFRFPAIIHHYKHLITVFNIRAALFAATPCPVRA